MDSRVSSEASGLVARWVSIGKELSLCEIATGVAGVHSGSEPHHFKEISEDGLASMKTDLGMVEAVEDFRLRMRPTFNIGKILTMEELWEVIDSPLMN